MLSDFCRRFFFLLGRQRLFGCFCFCFSGCFSGFGMGFNGFNFRFFYPRFCSRYPLGSTLCLIVGPFGLGIRLLLLPLVGFFSPLLLFQLLFFLLLEICRLFLQLLFFLFFLFLFFKLSKSNFSYSGFWQFCSELTSRGMAYLGSLAAQWAMISFFRSSVASMPGFKTTKALTFCIR